MDVKLTFKQHVFTYMTPNNKHP